MPFLVAAADLTHPIYNNRSSNGMIGCFRQRSNKETVLFSESITRTPISYCLPKPLFLYGSMMLLSGTIPLTMYYSVYV